MRTDGRTDRRNHDVGNRRFSRLCERAKKWKAFMEVISVLCICLSVSVCLSVCDIVRQHKLLDFQECRLSLKTCRQIVISIQTVSQQTAPSWGPRKDKPAAKNAVAICVHCCVKTQLLSVGTPLALRTVSVCQCEELARSRLHFFDTSILLSLLLSREPWTSSRACYFPVLPTCHGISPVTVL